jgi:anaerobic ribonucleoside-triphosphate reductase
MIRKSPFKNIKKRDRNIVIFDDKKIEVAITAANKSTKEIPNDSVKGVVDRVNALLIFKYYDDPDNITVENVQDTVEESLMVAGFCKTAKAYILYRDQRNRIRNVEGVLNFDIINEYLDESSWRVKENSNMAYSLQGLNNHIANRITSEYWLNEIYHKAIRDAHTSGDIHIHDLGMLSVYCVGWDLEDLLMIGFGGVSGKIESTPPKHFDSALGQIVNFFYTLQGESAGAQAFSNFDTLLAPFILKDNLTYKEVKQKLQSFLFNINVPTRVGFQSPFTNITLDINVPKYFKDKPAIIGGEYTTDITYNDCQDQMDLFNQAFADLIMGGDAKNRIFTFPIITLNITKDFDWEDTRYDKLFQVAGKFGTYYFQNFVNSDMKPEDTRSMCPLHPDTRVLIACDSTYHNVRIEDFYKDFEPNKFEVVNKEGNLDKVVNVINTNVDTVIKFNVNGTEVIMSLDHDQPVMDAPFDIAKGLVKIMKASEIKLGMYLPFVNNYFNEDFRGIFVNDEGKDTLITRSFESERGYHDGRYCKWFPVDDIEFIHGNTDMYCLTVDSTDHLFQLSNGLITHNCRLSLDNKQLNKRIGGLFSSAPLTGSIGVVTINLPRIAHKARLDGGVSDDYEDVFFTMLCEVFEKAKNSLVLKRRLLEYRTDNGLYPYSKHYLRVIKEKTGKYWTNHFSTIGIIGMNECCLTFIGDDIGSDVGMEFSIKVMKYLRNLIKKTQEGNDDLFNLEATPAEGTSYRLAKLDKAEFPDIITDGSKKIPFYTNSTQLPVNYSDDLFECLELQEPLQTLYTGGTVFHAFLGEMVSDVNIVKSLVRKIASSFKLPYFTLTPTFSICPNHGYISGEVFVCPDCNEETEVYSRVVGYHRPVKQWNKGKSEEFDKRLTFKGNMFNRAKSKAA